MGVLLVILVLSWLITKTVSDAKTDRALAEKGIVSPRLQAKYGDQARVKTARYGMGDYLADAWSDNWRNRTEVRRVAAQAVAVAEPAPGAVRVTVRDRVRAVRGGLAKLGRTLVEPVETKPARPGRPIRPVPTGDPSGQGAPVTPAPAALDTHRNCPMCGETVTRDGDRWRHTPESVCTEPDTPTTPEVASGPPSAPPPVVTAADGEAAPVHPPRRGPRSPQPVATTSGRSDAPRCRTCGTPIDAYRNIQPGRGGFTSDQRCPRCGWHKEPREPQRPNPGPSPTGPAPTNAAVEDDPVLCAKCGRALHGRWKGYLGGNTPVCHYGCHSVEQPPPRNCTCRICQPDERQPASPERNGGKPMSGEAVNYETTVAELDALIAELRQWLEACIAALNDAEQAKNHITDMQSAFRSAASRAGNIVDHLAGRLDPTSVAHFGTLADALPASAVDQMLAALEEAEQLLKGQKDNAETALSTAEAALAHVVAEYGEEAAKVAQNLGGDASFLNSAGGGGGGSAVPAPPVGASV